MAGLSGSLPLYCLLACVGAAGPAWAGSATAEFMTVVITRQDCARLVKHLPDADVAYQPGQDVYGRPVAPADLDGGLQIELPETYSFDVLIQPIDFARRRALEAERARLQAIVAADPSQAPGLADELAALDAEEAAIDARGLSETTMSVGRVTIDSDGRATFNGQPLESEEQAELAARCQQVMQKPQP
ncbi:MAG: hypothetical protein ACFCUQ_14410 [Kiloniellales bacterium]